MIAKIAVASATFAIDKPYSYWIPEGMRLSVGCRVQVPFGRGNPLTWVCSGACYKSKIHNYF